jgi:sarcosine oxidase subunit gamma
MAELARRQAPQFAATSWLRPLPPASRLILHGGKEVRALASGAWGIVFAEQACRAQSQGSRATLWMGPDEYLLIEEDLAAVTPHAALAQALASLPHALVDISHRQIAFEIKGQHAEAILAGGCPLDLHIEAFPLGMCTRTICGKADMVLWRISGDTFHVEVWRSFSDYFIALLTEIARDIVA